MPIEYEKLKKIENEIIALLNRFENEEITENELHKKTRSLLEENNVSHDEIDLMIPPLMQRMKDIERILLQSYDSDQKP